MKSATNLQREADMNSRIAKRLRIMTMTITFALLLFFSLETTSTCIGSILAVWLRIKTPGGATAGFCYKG